MPGVTVTSPVTGPAGRARGVPPTMVEKSPHGVPGRILTLYSTPGLRFGMV